MMTTCRYINAPVRLLLIVVMISVFQVAGCGIARRPDIVDPVPAFRYPSQGGEKHLQLVSILTDPYAEAFYQGSLLSKKTDRRKSLSKPVAIAFGPVNDYYLLDYGSGVVYVTDYADNGVLEKTRTLPRGIRRFPSAVDMALAPDRKLWVTDSRLKRVFILESDGEIIDSITGWFNRPVGVVYHPTMNKMLVTDLAANSITAFNLDGRLDGVYGTETGLELNSPSYIAVGPDGDIYVVEGLTGLVRILDENLKPKRVFGGLGDGPGYFSKPKGIAVDDDKNIYVADALFDNVQIFDQSGRLLLTLGTSGSSAGQFWQPAGITIDGEQRILVADMYNRRIQVFEWGSEVDR